MRLLDVFSGSQTLRNVFIDDGHEVISIDNKKYRNSSPDTLIMDFLDFDYTTYQPDHFDVLFFGLPCTAFSKASGGKHFDKNFLPRSQTAINSELLLHKCFDTINYFYDATFYIENPSGGLCNHPLMKSFVNENKIAVYRIFMSQYGFTTPKQTDIFTNNYILAFFDSFYRKNGRYSKNKFNNLSLKQKQAYPVNFCKMILEWTYLNELSKLPE